MTAKEQLKKATSVIGYRHIAAPLVFVSLLRPTYIASQDEGSKNPPRTSGEQSLNLKIIGHGKMKATGATAGFRIYAAADGTEAEVWYADFRSVQEAEIEIEQQLKPFTVASKEQTKNPSGHADGDRIVAFIQHTNPSGKAFLLIRRDGLVGYFIRSDSLPVAMKVEALIQPQDCPSPTAWCQKPSPAFR